MDALSLIPTCQRLFNAYGCELTDNTALLGDVGVERGSGVWLVEVEQESEDEEVFVGFSGSGLLD